VAGFVAFQGSYIQDLIDATDYPKWDILAVNKLWVQWRVDKEENILSFRDKSHISAHTGVQSTTPATPWTKQFDFSDEGFIKNVQA
jgi:trimethylamine monooxygenase